MYVYIRSEPGLYTVGHYAPDGSWVAESDHEDWEAAAERVHWLNGGDREVTITKKVEAWPCCDYSTLPGICGANSPRNYSCTRGLGHDGPHIACGDKDHRLDTWTDHEIEGEQP